MEVYLSYESDSLSVGEAIDDRFDRRGHYSKGEMDLTLKSGR